MPIWPIVGILALTIIVVALAVYKISKLVMHYYDARTKQQKEDRNKADTDRKSIEQEIAEQLKNAGGYTPEQIEKLTHLAYSIWKLKNMHRFKPQRNFIDSFLDNIGVPLWNTAVTIFPTFFIINGICFYVFLLPSVLHCWPLFVIELVPAIILAIDFGRRKLGDNKHDLIKDAAALIIDEITNPKNGTLTACTKGKEPIAFESLGLESIFEKETGPEDDKERPASSNDFSHSLRREHNPVSLHLDPLANPNDHSPRGLESIPLLSPMSQSEQ